MAGIHYSTEKELWMRCRAATDESCPYADSHGDEWEPPEGVPTKDEWLEAERERKAVKAAISQERKRERNRKAQAAFRARQRAVKARGEREGEGGQNRS